MLRLNSRIHSARRHLATKCATESPLLGLQGYVGESEAQEAGALVGNGMTLLARLIETPPPLGESRRRTRRRLLKALAPEPAVRAAAFLAHAICIRASLNMTYADRWEEGDSPKHWQASAHRWLHSLLDAYFPVTREDGSALQQACAPFRVFELQPGSQQVGELDMFTGYCQWLLDQDESIASRAELAHAHMLCANERFVGQAARHALSYVTDMPPAPQSGLSRFSDFDDPGMTPMELMVAWSAPLDVYASIAAELLFPTVWRQTGRVRDSLRRFSRTLAATYDREPLYDSDASRRAIWACPAIVGRGTKKGEVLMIHSAARAGYALRKTEEAWGSDDSKDAVGELLRALSTTARDEHVHRDTHDDGYISLLEPTQAICARHDVVFDECLPGHQHRAIAAVPFLGDLLRHVAAENNVPQADTDSISMTAKQAMDMGYCIRHLEVAFDVGTS